jgi:hypothetical protein
MNLPPQRPVSLVPGHPRSYNLNIHAYSFEEMLGIFGLTYEISLEDMKRAKKQVMMSHPDKSNLPNEYFQFYRQAYAMVLTHYESMNKLNVTTSANTSHPKKMSYNVDAPANTGIQRAAKNLDVSQFNRLFEENVATRPDPAKNQWFNTENAPSAFAHSGKVSAGNIGSAMNTIRTNAAQQGALTKYNGVQEMRYGGGASFYEADDEEDDAEDVYVVCDPFSKLKFDDLRKVHRDQTIFNVSEGDFERMNRAGNIQAYQTSRNSQDVAPLQKQQAEALLRQQESEHRERMARKQHADQLRMLNMQDRVKNVEAYFMQLENGKN